MRKPVVFLGPSASRAVAGSILEAEYRPPVRRGDIEALKADPPSAVGVIDGYFSQNLAVSPKEILALMRCGVPVYGASSMGALRAAELAAYGMSGVGRVFEWYASGRVDGDDEVAMIYSEDGGRALSEPLVNVRHRLECCVGERVLTVGEARRILVRMRGLHFAARTRQALLRAAAMVIGEERLACVVPVLGSAPDLKHLDALALLRRMSGDHAARRAEASFEVPDR